MRWKRSGLAALANGKRKARKGRGRNGASELAALAALAICQLLCWAVSVYLEKKGKKVGSSGERREKENETSPNKVKWK